jgi:hypothetical protein
MVIDVLMVVVYELAHAGQLILVLTLDVALLAWAQYSPGYEALLRFHKHRWKLVADL